MQDTIETTAFTFTGSDDKTSEEDLQFECRLLELEFTEAPEPVAPWDPIPIEEQWTSCSSPWSVPLMEEGFFTFEIRAIDRAGNVETTPTIHHFSGTDESPPNTILTEKPALVSPNRSATFTFTAIDDQTPPQFAEYECRLDSRDPDMWLECFNPAVYGNLTSGTHTFEVRALDVAENMDPTPARYTWTVGSPASSDAANVALTALADAVVDQEARATTSSSSRSSTSARRPTATRSRFRRSRSSATTRACSSASACRRTPRSSRSSRRS